MPTDQSRQVKLMAYPPNVEGPVEAVPTGRIKYTNHGPRLTSMELEVTYSYKQSLGWPTRLWSMLTGHGDCGPVAVHLHTMFVAEKFLFIQEQPVVKIYDCESKTMTTVAG